MYAIGLTIVLASHDMSPGCYGKIITHMQDGFIFRFCKQFESVCLKVYFEYLTKPFRASIGTGKVNLVIFAGPHSFASRKARGTHFQSTNSKIILFWIDMINVYPFYGHLLVYFHFFFFPVSGIQTLLIDNG